MEWALRDTVSWCFHRSRNTVDEGVRSKRGPNFSLSLLHRPANNVDDDVARVEDGDDE